MSIFIELTLIIIIATVCATAARLLRQPLIVGYLIAGIIVGPYVFNILQSKEYIELFSKIGITVLLFIMGLNLNPRVVKEVGKVSLITGVGQVLFTSLTGFIIALVLGIERVAALYVAIALTFSSTIIILKLLSDKGDLNALYGKIAIGFLLVQDIIATIILLLISSFATTSSYNLMESIGFFLIKGAGLVGLLYLVSGYIIPRISGFIASSAELLFVFSLAWGLGIATLFSVLGFSIEIGALVAGVVFSITPFAFEIGARLKSLRDFFIVLFFILLGSQMAISSLGSLLVPGIVLSVFVLIGNPIIVIILMNLLGYKRKTGFLAGLTVAQISEFSLILAALGFTLGHLSQEILSLVTFVGLVTIVGSTYFILYSDTLYSHLEHLLRFLELRKSSRESAGTRGEYESILFGFDRVGQDFIKAFRAIGRPYLVVDFNPAAIQRLTDAQIPYRFGDAEDVEFLVELGLDQIKLAVSTIPDFKINLLLTQKVRKANSRAIIIVLSHNTTQAHELYAHGATYVMMPHYLGARYVSQMITRLGIDGSAFKEEQEKHLEYLQRRMSRENKIS